MIKAFIVDDAARAIIRTAVERARSRPVPWETLKDVAIADAKPILSLADRKGKPEPNRAEHVLFPGYRAAISFEHQPAGMFRHLSVSSYERGRMPHPAMIGMLVKEFGFIHWPPKIGRVWIEEFEPGWHAINVIELVEAGPE